MPLAVNIIILAGIFTPNVVTVAGVFDPRINLIGVSDLEKKIYGEMEQVFYDSPRLSQIDRSGSHWRRLWACA
jgi:hypothetical protein